MLFAVCPLSIASILVLSSGYEQSPGFSHRQTDFIVVISIAYNQFLTIGESVKHIKKTDEINITNKCNYGESFFLVFVKKKKKKI